MRLARESHERLEKFFREHTNDSQLELPPIHVYSGRVARFLTKRLHIGAITFGRRIFFSPNLVAYEEGVRSAPGWLLAHETTHVLQYERDGFIRFFIKYLRSYFQTLRKSRRWDREARMDAYLSIPAELAAQEVEHAFKAWSATN